MKFEKRWLLLGLVLIVYLIGMFIDVIEVDSAQYAAMSQEMVQTGNYLEIYYNGLDYIDKPPLVFWASALSFNLFGVSNFTFKLPSVLFTLLGLFATYRLGTMYYGRWAGYFSTIILASCHAWFQFNQDVRTDALLAGSTIFAVWQLAEYTTHKRLWSLVWAGVGIAGAMLAKGPIGLMVPVVALGTDLLLKRNWRMIFHWQWILLLPVVLICLAPMMYGLYTQFDATGGKSTFNNGFITSGLRFYFWTQSFGRITGESTWQNDTGPFFFIHTFLWAFLPWSLLFVFALGTRLKKIVLSGFIIKKRKEALTIGGILFPWIAFSLSQYKLPHYIFVFFPLAAILTGAFIRKLVKKNGRDFAPLKITQYVVSVILLLLAILAFVLFPSTNVVVIVIAFAGAFFTIYHTVYRGSRFKQILLPSFFAVLTLNFVFNAHFYPELLKYAAGNIAGQIATSTKKTLVGFGYNPYGMDFYNGKAVVRYDSIITLKENEAGKTILIYTNAEGAAKLRSDSVNILKDSVLQHYHVSTLRGKFLSPKTRSTATTEMHLLEARP